MRTHVIYSVLSLVPFIKNGQSEQIECIGTKQCYNKTITCINNEENCFVLCNGESSCSFSTILCPQDHARSCSLTCSDTLSCNHITIKAKKASSLNIVSSGGESLSSSHIYCPGNILSGGCNLTYFGTQHGFNMMHLYSIYDYSSIDIECESLSTCWSSDSNPQLHFGDMYSKTCFISLISNLTQCKSQLLDTSTIMPADDKVTPQNYNRQSLDFVVQLLLIGAVGGVLISIFCCLFFFGVRYCKTHKTMTLSPSLKKLSPELKPSDLEVVDMGTLTINDEKEPGEVATDATEKAPNKANKTSNVIVTVQQYANAENKCDESATSRDSPAWFSKKFSSIRFSIFSPQSTIFSQSIDFLGGAGEITDGIAPDEFVVNSDTDENRITSR